MRRIHLLIMLLFVTVFVQAQVGGAAVYAFLNIPASARIAALGGTFISVKDNDINCALQAPSLINPSLNNSLAFSGVAYVDGVKFGDVAFAKDLHQYGTGLVSIHYANYGNFLETDNLGNINGTFKAADYALTFGWGYQYNNYFSIGAALKGIYSDYYLYHAFGIAADISGTFSDTTHHITFTLEGRNIGSQLKNYVNKNNEPLPAEVLFGISKRLLHTPLRFNLTYRHLEKFDLAYDDPNDLGDVDPLTGEATVKKITTINKLTRHFILSEEILLSKNFHLRLAYNFQRRRELKVDTSTGIAGFSFGLGLKVSKFILGYAYGSYHLAGGANHISISANLSEFTRKK